MFGGVGLKVSFCFVNFSTDLTRILPDLISVVDPHHVVPHGGPLDVFPTDVARISDYPVNLNVVTREKVKVFKLNVTALTLDLFILRLPLLSLLPSPVSLLPMTSQLLAAGECLPTVLALVVRRRILVRGHVFEEGLPVDEHLLTELTLEHSSTTLPFRHLLGSSP